MLCARCAELGAQFGKLYGAAGPELTRLRGRQPAGAMRCCWLELLMVALHAAAAITVLPAALRVIVRAPRSALDRRGGGLRGVWVPLGGVLAAIAAWALWRGRRWGGALARAHAFASLPSMVLTPLAAFVMQQTRPGERRRG